MQQKHILLILFSSEIICNWVRNYEGFDHSKRQVCLMDACSGTEVLADHTHH